MAHAFVEQLLINSAEQEIPYCGTQGFTTYKSAIEPCA